MKRLEFSRIARLTGRKQGENPVDIPATRHSMPAMRAAFQVQQEHAEKTEKEKSPFPPVQIRPRGVGELDFDKSISDDTASPYIDNIARLPRRLSGLLVATKPELREGLASELREYIAVYVQSDAEIGLFSDEVVVNCAPQV